MAGENAMLVRRFMAAFNAQDVRELVSCCHPEIELHSTFTAIGGAVYSGQDGVRRWYHDLVREWGEPRSEIEAIYEVDSELLALTVLYGRGRQSGSEANLPGALVMRVRDSQLVYFRGFAHREDALEELGVAEDQLGPNLA